MLNYGYSGSHGSSVLTMVNIKTLSRNRRYYPGTRTARRASASLSRRLSPTVIFSKFMLWRADEPRDEAVLGLMVTVEWRTDLLEFAAVEHGDPPRKET